MIRDSEDVAELLLERGASIGARSRSGFTPLHVAVEKDALKCAGVLVDAGADVSARAQDGATPLRWAASGGKREMIEVLSHKAEPAKPDPPPRQPVQRPVAPVRRPEPRIPGEETIKYDDYVSCGSEQAAKEAGKMRLEGREYIVQDGDVMHFLFNL